MALQGTLDSFPLTDVLRLLASSSKSGRLVVNGDRGHGQIWLASGAVTGGETSIVPSGGDPTEAVFDLLRFATGSFIFEPDAPNPNPTASLPVDYVIAQSEAALAEWRELLAVVPSADAWLIMSPELPQPEVVIDQTRWTYLTRIGAGIDVTSFGQVCGLGEVANLRVLRELILSGLVSVGVRPLPAEPVPGVAEEPEDVPWERWDAEVFEPSGSSPGPEVDPELFGAFEPFAAADDATVTPPAPAFEPVPEPSPQPSALEAPSEAAFTAAEVPEAPAAPPVHEDADDDADDVLRQMAVLSPKAAQAVAAAMSGEGSVASDALPDSEAERERLLKFLGSV